jgi:hypothetical protein
MADEKKAKGSAVKNIVMVVFIIAAALFVWKKLEERGRIQKENEAIAVFEDDNFAQALKQFEALLDGAKTDEARKRHQSNIARCYIGMAEEPGLSVADQMVFYRKAAEFDESMITSPAIQKALQTERAKQEAGAMDGTAPAPAE